MYKTKLQMFPIYEVCLFEIVLTDELNRIEDKQEFLAFVTRQEKEYKGIKNHNCISVYLNPNHSSTPLSMGILTHEAVHVKNMLFKLIRHKHSYKHDEPEAYFVEWVFNQMMEVCMKNNAITLKNNINE